MNKAFVKEDDGNEGALPLPEMPAGVRNYITPTGYRRLQQDLQHLLDAAGRSADIEQRIRYLRGRLETAEVVDASMHAGSDRVYFGATVRYRDDHQGAAGAERTVTIVGLDETDPACARISWLSPVAQALLGAQAGDEVVLESADGPAVLHVVAVHYPTRPGGAAPGPDAGERS